MARREVADGWQIGNCKIPPADLLRARGYAGYVPPVVGVVIAADGAIWVLRGKASGEPRAIDVFSGEGVYLGSLLRNPPFPVAFRTMMS
jgi:hypothetical protein